MLWTIAHLLIMKKTSLPCTHWPYPSKFWREDHWIACQQPFELRPTLVAGKKNKVQKENKIQPGSSSATSLKINRINISRTSGFIVDLCGPKKASGTAHSVELNYPNDSKSGHSSVWLVVHLPIRKIWKSVRIIIPNIWKNKKCSKPPISCFGSVICS
jgi:hypothetical protein